MLGPHSFATRTAAERSTGSTIRSQTDIHKLNNQSREARLFVCREQLRSQQTRSTVRHNTLSAGKVEAPACLVKTASAAVNNQRQIRFIDFFAGCGGLSEGFIQAGYAPVAHVEIDQNTWRGR